jgi:hypothetical protein
MIAIPSNPETTQAAPLARAAADSQPTTLNTTQSLHRDFLEKSIPPWLSSASPQRREALKTVPTALPAWYLDATPAQRKTLADSMKASVVAQNDLDRTMATLQDVETFARPLLLKALED